MQTCTAVSKNGKPCRNRAKYDGLCGTHGSSFHGSKSTASLVSRDDGTGLSRSGSSQQDSHQQNQSVPDKQNMQYKVVYVSGANGAVMPVKIAVTPTDEW